MHAMHFKLFVDLKLFCIVEVMKNYRVSVELRCCSRQFPAEPHLQSAPGRVADYTRAIIQVC